MKTITTLLFATTLLSGQQVFAQTVMPGAPSNIQTIANQIEAQGYRVSEWKRSFLGRIIIEFDSTSDPNLEREIVINPTTGEIIRDFVYNDRDDDSNGRGTNDSSSDDDDHFDDNGGDRDRSTDDSRDDDDHDDDNGGDRDRDEDDNDDRDDDDDDDDYRRDRDRDDDRDDDN